jgi:hypothetical protein
VTGRAYGIRIEIEPLTAGHALWPMVSVTEVNTSLYGLVSSAYRVPIAAPESSATRARATTVALVRIG